MKEEALRNGWAHQIEVGLIGFLHQLFLWKIFPVL
jgi:hypothetical protein